MGEKPLNIILQILVTILLFSLWAGFALLIVNPNFHQDLPGYTIGRICIWEGVAIILAGIIAHLIYRKWGGVKIIQKDNRRSFQLNINYGIFFMAYLAFAMMVGIWQFYVFSLNF